MATKLSIVGYENPHPRGALPCFLQKVVRVGLLDPVGFYLTITVMGPDQGLSPLDEPNIKILTLVPTRIIYDVIGKDSCLPGVLGPCVSHPRAAMT